MKKWQRLVAFVTLLFLLAGCSVPVPSSAPQVSSKELLPTVNTGNTGSIAYLVTEEQWAGEFGQEIWSAISRFGSEEGVGFQYFITPPGSKKAVMATLAMAVQGGSTLVVVNGAEMAQMLASAHDDFPDITVVFVDASPPPEVPLGTAWLSFSEEQAGWLAGYAAVQEGIQTIGLFDTADMSGARYALGFALGADAAALAMELPEHTIYLHTITLNRGETDDELQLRLEDLFSNNIALLFCNVQKTQDIAIEAALNQDKSVITAYPVKDIHSKVISAALQKTPREVLLTLLGQWKDGTLPDSFVLHSGVAEQAVLLQIDANLFTKFSEWEYQNACKKLLDPDYLAYFEQQVQLDANGNLPELNDLALQKVALGRKPVQHATVEPVKPEETPEEPITSETAEG